MDDKMYRAIQRVREELNKELSDWEGPDDFKVEETESYDDYCRVDVSFKLFLKDRYVSFRVSESGIEVDMCEDNWEPYCWHDYNCKWFWIAVLND